MDITITQLKSFFEDTPEQRLQDYLDPLNKVMATFHINNPYRVSMFLAQVGVESGGFREIEENLNYSAEGLLRTFPKYFRTVDPNDYAHNPEKIANRVYKNRMGNGDEDSGDGWKFRGRGLIQITGKYNYEALAHALGYELDQTVEYLQTPLGACMSAGWYWNSRDLNHFADEEDVLTCTKRINGGTIGLDQREALYKEALTIFV